MKERLTKESVLGIYCFTYVDHQGKPKHTCSHCVELVMEYMTPETQSLLLDAQRMRWALESIVEYWNGSPESAVDAAEEMRFRAKEALRPSDPPKETT